MITLDCWDRQTISPRSCLAGVWDAKDALYASCYARDGNLIISSEFCGPARFSTIPQRSTNVAPPPIESLDFKSKNPPSPAMKHLERFKQKVLKRPGSPASVGSDTSQPGIEKPPRKVPSENQTGNSYGLIDLREGLDEEKHSDSERFPVDIIAVHGLGGDAYNTWTNKLTGALWLRDFVPRLLPGCRVYTFGYPAKLWDVEMRARVQEFGRSLLASVRDHIESTAAVISLETPLQSFHF